MGVPVPPAFAAYDSKRNQSGTLIEWFLNPIPLLGDEIYTPGGDYCQQYIESFDRKKGKQHNFETIAQIFNELDSLDWKNDWAKILLFDALIGNTDRHQDNWGIIVTPQQGNLASNKKMRISPVFDNGTSMGHEISSAKFKNYEDSSNIERYVSKGRHHMKWSINDTMPMEHVNMLKKFTKEYPETHQLMIECLNNINPEDFKSILDMLVAFNVPVRLTAERADFMLRLLQFRYQRLLHELEK
jgi:hypothetical protein